MVFLKTRCAPVIGAVNDKYIQTRVRNALRQHKGNIYGLGIPVQLID